MSQLNSTYLINQTVGFGVVCTLDGTYPQIPPVAGAGMMIPFEISRSSRKNFRKHVPKKWLKVLHSFSNFTQSPPQSSPLVFGNDLKSEPGKSQSNCHLTPRSPSRHSNLLAAGGLADVI